MVHCIRYSLILVLTVSCMLLGCDNDSGNQQKEASSPDMMKTVPSGWEAVVISDLDELRSVDYLRDNGSFLSHQIPDLKGIDPGDMDRVLLVTYEEIDTIVAEGRFDLDALRNNLIDEEYIQDEYRGIEIWADTGKGEAIALTENLVFIGPRQKVETCIGLLRDGGETLDADPLLNELMDNLPSGFSMVLVRGKAAQTLSGSDGHLEAIGLSHSEAPDNMIKTTVAYKFDSSETAQEGVTAIRSNVEGSQATGITAILDQSLTNRTEFDVMQNDDYVLLTIITPAQDYFRGDLMVDITTPESTINEYLKALEAFDSVRVARIATKDFALDVADHEAYLIDLGEGESLKVSNLILTTLVQGGNDATIEAQFDLRFVSADGVEDTHETYCFQLLKVEDRWLIDAVRDYECDIADQ